jgi:hypothetical protein
MTFEQLAHPREGFRSHFILENGNRADNSFRLSPPFFVAVCVDEIYRWIADYSQVLQLVREREYSQETRHVSNEKVEQTHTERGEESVKL